MLGFTSVAALQSKGKEGQGGGELVATAWKPGDRRRMPPGCRRRRCAAAGLRCSLETRGRLPLSLRTHPDRAAKASRAARRSSRRGIVRRAWGRCGSWGGAADAVEDRLVAGQQVALKTKDA